MMQTVSERLKQERIIAIIRGVPGSSILETVRALVAGGVHCVEITFDPSSEANSADTLVSIARITAHFGDEVCVGAGTVLTAEQVERAVAAGAQYIISPNVDEAVIRRTKALGKTSIPGAMTPTETVNAHHFGADIVKLFPAGIFGPEYIKALKAPLSHISVCAVGGVNEHNIAEFIAAGAESFGIGSNLVNAKLVAAGQFAEITTRARLLRDAVEDC